MNAPDTPSDTDVSDPPAPSVFSLIIQGRIPGRFVWRDDEVVAFLTIAPMRPGHTLVVPIAEIDLWTDVPRSTWARIGEVCQAIGRAQMTAFAPVRVGSIIAGLEVPHCHVHLVPIDSESDLSFAAADPDPDPAALDDAAERLRAALRADGHGEHVPD